MMPSPICLESFERSVHSESLLSGISGRTIKEMNVADHGAAGYRV